jgi:hypothetical protein
VDTLAIAGLVAMLVIGLLAALFSKRGRFFGGDDRRIVLRDTPRVRCQNCKREEYVRPDGIAQFCCGAAMKPGTADD